MMVELSPATAAEYVRKHGLLPDGANSTADVLGGGVSNHVVQVTWDGDCLVLKQPLPNLAVEDDWPADVVRVHNEASAARAYADVISEAGFDDVRVPAVAFEDEENHVIGIECAPANARMWKQDLLNGSVDTTVARAVGRVLGRVHRITADDDALRSAFASKRPFDQLRIDPYHRTTSERHPDVAGAIRDEARRVLSIDRTLVHGDYSPKNVLVNDGGDELVAWILDFEVAHWGDPAFDVGFMLNHLFIKSVYNHEIGDAYENAARAFHDAYRDHAPWDVERETVAELAVLMLARVDGKSPVEYVEEGPIARTLRRIAKRVLGGSVRTFDGFAGIVREERAPL